MILTQRLGNDEVIIKYLLAILAIQPDFGVFFLVFSQLDGSSGHKLESVSHLCLGDVSVRFPPSAIFLKCGRCQDLNKLLTRLLTVWLKAVVLMESKYLPFD